MMMILTFQEEKVEGNATHAGHEIPVLLQYTKWQDNIVSDFVHSWESEMWQLPAPLTHLNPAR